jgi:hypothetical protein
MNQKNSMVAEIAGENIRLTVMIVFGQIAGF